MGNNDVTGIGIASVIHHVATHNVTARTALLQDSILPVKREQYQNKQ